MKNRLSLVLALCGLLASHAVAQLPGLGDSSAGMPGTDVALMARLFAKHPTFSSQLEIHVYDKDQKETLSAVMDFVYSNTKMRMDVDVTKLKNKDIPPAVLQQLATMNMDQIYMLIRPDKLSSYVIYPKLKVYLSVPLAKEDVEDSPKSKMESQSIGKETLDGHSCAKEKVTFTPATGEKQELTVWKASDLKDFPVQILSKDKDENTVVMHYKQVQMGAPDATRFELPTDFTGYKNQQEMVAGLMSKMIGGAAPK